LTVLPTLLSHHRLASLLISQLLKDIGIALIPWTSMMEYQSKMLVWAQSIFPIQRLNYTAETNGFVGQPPNQQSRRTSYHGMSHCQILCLYTIATTLGWGRDSWWNLKKYYLLSDYAMEKLASGKCCLLGSKEIAGGFIIEYKGSNLEMQSS
jgi:hypothetical protein